jgi:hypothetical protein
MPFRSPLSVSQLRIFASHLHAVYWVPVEGSNGTGGMPEGRRASEEHRHILGGTRVRKGGCIEPCLKQFQNKWDIFHLCLHDNLKMAVAWNLSPGVVFSQG